MRDTAMTPIYDVNSRGYGTGFDLSLEGALSYQRVHGGTVMISRDGGTTWSALDPLDHTEITEK